MFSYDDGLLADIVWNRYAELQKEHIQLQARMVVAEKVCISLQEKIDELEVTLKELESSEDKLKSSKEDD
tara:strand:+ start:1670 stop:1879 length:210 start_codon:yes stop_codon:yes gene_type:complete